MRRDESRDDNDDEGRDEPSDQPCDDSRNRLYVVNQISVPGQIHCLQTIA